MGRELSPRLDRRLIDLDFEFCAAIAEIGGFIRDRGYGQYRAENLALASRLVASASAPMIFVASSGFLAAERGSDDYRDARALVRSGYGITLLPSLDIDLATPIVVERQLTRGLGLEVETETRKFRERFERYRNVGEMIVASIATPAEIADTIEQALLPRGQLAANR